MESVGDFDLVGPAGNFAAKREFKFDFGIICDIFEKSS